MIRHGELLIIPVKDIPAGGEVTEHDSFIAGHSETGHHHVLERPAQTTEVLNDVLDETERLLKVHKMAKGLFVDILKDAELRHKKTGEHAHDTVSIPAGKYEIRQKQEYDFRTNAMRQVWD